MARFRAFGFGGRFSSWLCGWIDRDAGSRAVMAVCDIVEDQGGWRCCYGGWAYGVG